MYLITPQKNKNWDYSKRDQTNFFIYGIEYSGEIPKTYSEKKAGMD